MNVFSPAPSPNNFFLTLSDSKVNPIAALSPALNKGAKGPITCVTPWNIPLTIGIFISTLLMKDVAIPPVAIAEEAFSNPFRKFSIFCFFSGSSILARIESLLLAIASETPKLAITIGELNPNVLVIPLTKGTLDRREPPTIPKAPPIPPLIRVSPKAFLPPSSLDISPMSDAMLATLEPTELLTLEIQDITVSPSRSLFIFSITASNSLSSSETNIPLSPALDLPYFAISLFKGAGTSSSNALSPIDRFLALLIVLRSVAKLLRNIGPKVKSKADVFLPLALVTASSLAPLLFSWNIRVPLTSLTSSPCSFIILL